MYHKRGKIMEPIQSNLTKHADNIIKTLTSLNEMDGKIDYNENQGLFQKIVTSKFNYLKNYFYGETEGDHVEALAGLSALKNRIMDFSEQVKKSNPENVAIIAEKIDQMKSLIVGAQIVILQKVIPSYNLEGLQNQGDAIKMVYKDLTQTCMNSISQVRSALLPPSDLPPLPFWLREDQSDQQQPAFVGTKEKIESFILEPEAESKKPSTLPPSIKSQPNVIVINTPKTYQFPISKDEAKLLASEKEETKEASLFAGRNLFTIKGILKDYIEKFEDFEEQLEKYVSSKESETIAKSEHDKLSPQTSGLRGGARGGPAPMKTRGGPAPIKSKAKTVEVSDPQKDAAWERYETAKTQRMRSQKKLAELLFPDKEKDFDVNKLKEYQVIFTSKLNEKIKAYSAEIKHLESIKNQPVAKKVDTAESIQQRKLQLLIQNLKNLSGVIKTAHLSILRLEKELSILPDLIKKKRSDMDKNQDIDLNEKLKSELEQLTKRQKTIPIEIQEQQAKLDLNKPKLQDDLKTQTTDTEALLKLANIEIERLS